MRCMIKNMLEMLAAFRGGEMGVRHGRWDFSQ
jgi:hypothetical protein